MAKGETTMGRPEQWVAILDFGSQYTQLIARRIRECKVFSEIVPFNVSAKELSASRPSAIVLSGGPASVAARGSPLCDTGLFDLGVPVLGICYGMQLMGQLLGGKVKGSRRREYGGARLEIDRSVGIFKGLRGALEVWMSHGDAVTSLPTGFERIAHTGNSPFAAMRDSARQLYGVQFHPEVAHTPQGGKLLRNFLYDVAKCSPTWTMESFVRQKIAEIRATVPKGRVLCGVSGGVDSSALALLLHKAIGKRLICVFVNNGLLRKDEAKQVLQTFRSRLSMRIRYVNGESVFLENLEGIDDPEEKRKAIGRVFVELFEKQAQRGQQVDYLAQGTLYPDVIESQSAFGGPSATIKTHHNVGGLPARMRLKLMEPFRLLFKDEVRMVARELGLPAEMADRHPFPGPGLAVRILGPVTKERLNILREADAIFIEELKRSGHYDRVWQALAVLLPVRTVGVMGDERTYQNVIALRAVSSTDGMTADWAKLPDELLQTVASRIANEVHGVNRVVYDVTTKPPATIEWE